MALMEVEIYGHVSSWLILFCLDGDSNITSAKWMYPDCHYFLILNISSLLVAKIMRISQFSFNQFVISKPLSYCFKETIGFNVKASFASRPLSRLIRWYNRPGDITKKAIEFHGTFQGLKITNCNISLWPTKEKKCLESFSKELRKCSESFAVTINFIRKLWNICLNIFWWRPSSKVMDISCLGNFPVLHSSLDLNFVGRLFN